MVVDTLRAIKVRLFFFFFLTKFPAYFIALNGSSNIFGVSVSKISAATASLLAAVVVFFLVVFFVFGLEVLSAKMSSVKRREKCFTQIIFHLS